jgi:hypothetical protein
MKYQRGVALSGLMFWGVIVILLAILGMKVVPTAIEYYTIKKNTKAVVQQASPEATVADLRRSFQKFAEIDQIALPASELDIFKDRTGQIVIAFAYEKRIPLFGNASLLIEYKGSTAE